MDTYKLNQETLSRLQEQIRKANKLREAAAAKAEGYHELNAMLNEYNRLQLCTYLFGESSTANARQFSVVDALFLHTSKILYGLQVEATQQVIQQDADLQALEDMRKTIQSIIAAKP